MRAKDLLISWANDLPVFLRVLAQPKFLTCPLAALLVLGGSGEAQARNRNAEVEKALRDGKAVLISKAGILNPDSDITESIALPGHYRPPLTYWIHRETQQAFVLGAVDSSEGRGRALTNRHFYYVLEPGFYDFAGYVKKERLGDLNRLSRTDEGISSSIGFVNFSETTLPNFYTYQAWVPPKYTGTTFDGYAMTSWYSPGHYETRGKRNTTNGIFVDMRGLVPNASDGKSNIASFLVEAGQVVVAPDFKFEFTHGDCNVPAEGHWVCPLTSLTFSTAFTEQHTEVRAAMTRLKYRPDLVQKVQSGFLAPGEFFRTQKMEVDTGSVTAAGQPYGKFRVTLLTMPKPGK